MSSPQTSAPSSQQLFKRLLQGSSLYSVAIVGQRLVSIALLPITTRYLTPADYGVLDLLEQVGSVLALLLGSNLSAALGYFYFRTEASWERRRIVSTTVLGACVIGLAAAALCWPAAGVLARAVFENESARRYLLIVFLTMPANFLLESLLSWLRVEDRPGLFVVATALRLVVTVSGVVVLVALLRMRVMGVLSTSLAATALPAAAFAVFCFRRAGTGFDFRVFRRIAKFALPLGLSGVAMFIMHFGDRFILPHYRSFAELGIYSLAYKFGMMISVIYASFLVYWSAQSFDIMRREDADAVFARISTYAVAGVAYCGLGIALFARPAIRLLAAPAYQDAAALVPIIVAAYGVRSIGEFFRCLFLVEGRPGYDAVCTWLATATCIGGYLALIPRFGVRGAAVATLATFVVFTSVSIVWTYHLRRYRVEGRRLGKIGIATAAVAVSQALLPRAASVSDEIARGAALMAAFPLILWLLRFPTKGEWHAGRSTVQRLASRFTPAVEPAGD